MSAKPFTFPIKVLPDDIDFMGHVNNARYLNWVQDTVLAHWQKLAPGEEVASKAWVALKHEITYRRPAFLDDDVIAETVLEKIAGARSFYNTVIRRGEDVLAEVLHGLRQLQKTLPPKFFYDARGSELFSTTARP